MVSLEFQNYDTKILGVSIILSKPCIYIYIYISFSLIYKNVFLTIKFWWTIIVYVFTQPLCTDRMWHKVSF